MKLAIFAVLLSGIVLAGSAGADEPQAQRVEAEAAQAPVRWRERAADYRIELRGDIGQGPDTVRQEDSELQVQVVMANGLIVPLRSRGGVITDASDPTRRVFHQHLSGGSRYVTDLNVAAVEVIHLFRGFRVNESTSGATETTRRHYEPDQWDFVSIRLSARLYRRHPLTRAETLVAERVVLDASPYRRMSYGIWASAPLPEHFDPPPAIRAADGQIAVRVLTGRDDMKREAADAAVLIDTPTGVLRQPLGHLGLPAFSFWNHDAFARIDRTMRWAEIGRAGLFYRFGDHGPFERDDWEVEALLVDFCPRPLRRDRICFRQASHYVQTNLDASLARLNGDGDGAEIWAPFY